MVLQYCSDLHLEKMLRLPRIPCIAKVLFLAGDIGHPRSQLYLDFIRQTARDFQKIILVDGNHEFERYLPARDRNLPSNVILLQNSQYYFEEYNFYCLGTTLWTPSVNSQEYRKAVRFLEETLSQHPTVVMTHHVPSRQLMDPKYSGRKNLHRFYNNLEYIMHDPTIAPRFWIAGHSHSKMEKKIGYTNCLINTFPLQFTTCIPIHSLTR